MHRSRAVALLVTPSTLVSAALVFRYTPSATPLCRWMSAASSGVPSVWQASSTQAAPLHSSPCGAEAVVQGMKCCPCCVVDDRRRWRQRMAHLTEAAVPQPSCCKPGVFGCLVPHGRCSLPLHTQATHKRLDFAHRVGPCLSSSASGVMEPHKNLCYLFEIEHKLQAGRCFFRNLEPAQQPQHLNSLARSLPLATSNCIFQGKHR